MLWNYELKLCLPAVFNKLVSHFNTYANKPVNKPDYEPIKMPSSIVYFYSYSTKNFYGGVVCNNNVCTLDTIKHRIASGVAPVTAKPICVAQKSKFQPTTVRLDR